VVPSEVNRDYSRSNSTLGVTKMNLELNTKKWNERSIISLNELKLHTIYFISSSSQHIYWRFESFH